MKIPNSKATQCNYQIFAWKEKLRTALLLYVTGSMFSESSSSFMVFRIDSFRKRGSLPDTNSLRNMEYRYSKTFDSILLRPTQPDRWHAHAPNKQPLFLHKLYHTARKQLPLHLCITNLFRYVTFFDHDAPQSVPARNKLRNLAF
jgi:hypothetical protein